MFTSNQNLQTQQIIINMYITNIYLITFYNVMCLHPALKLPLPIYKLYDI